MTGALVGTGVAVKIGVGTGVVVGIGVLSGNDVAVGILVAFGVGLQEVSNINAIKIG